MKDKITAFVKKNNLISENDTVLIAFSGGADSVLLALYLISIRDEYSLKLKMAHIEHGIRGEESLADCEFSREFARQNGIEFFELHINAPEEAKALGRSVEEYSRERRYQFFDTIECDKIATAHNLSDNVETMLFRIARGTSLKGLCSIPVVRGNIIRPLLSVSSQEIRQYLDDNKIAYCVDSTNSDNSYTRNYIRNVVVPELKNVNSEFSSNAFRLIQSANEAYAFIEEYSESVYDKILVDDKLCIDALKSQNIAVAKQVIVKYFKSHSISLDEIHLNSVIEIMNKAGKTQLSGDYFAVSDGKYIRFAEFCLFDFNDYRVDKQIVSADTFLNNCELLNKKFDFYCDCDKISGNVCVRQRKEGDSVSPKGRNCTKTLKKLYNEYSIPVEKRNAVPVICDSLGVIGVYGYCVDARVAVDSSTRNVLIIDIRKDTEDNN